MLNIFKIGLQYDEQRLKYLQIQVRNRLLIGYNQIEIRLNIGKNKLKQVKYTLNMLTRNCQGYAVNQF